MCLEGLQLLTGVVLLHIVVNRLSAWIGCSAVPHVLATHIHPRAASTPAGLLLVSEGPGFRDPGVTVGKVHLFVD